MNANHEAERAVLGAVMLAGTVPPAVLDTGLTPVHFHASKAGHIFKRMLRLHDQGEPIDSVTVPEAAEYAVSVPNLGAVGEYARQVVEKAMWRSRRGAALEIIASAETEDEGAFARAESQLTIPTKTSGVWDRDRLAGLIFERMESGAPKGFPVPFFPSRVLRRKTVTLVGGWTSHGKTVFVDQWARALHEEGAQVWAWLNEMTAEERVLRHVSSVTGVPLGRLEEGRDLHREELERVARSANSLPFELVECPGWSVEDIARDIRIRKPDVAIIDILHRIPYRDERDLARISQVIGDCAKLANCALIATVHLNEKRVLSAARPQPTLGDIKGASALKQDADNVMFVWRKDDEDTGFPSNVGQLYYAKARQGKLGGVNVFFDGEHARFEKEPDLRSAVAWR